MENKTEYVVISLEKYDKLMNEIKDLKNVNEIKDMKNENEKLKLYIENMTKSLEEYNNVDEKVKEEVYIDNNFEITYYHKYYNFLLNKFKEKGYNNIDQIDVFLKELINKKDEKKEEGESKDE